MNILFLTPSDSKKNLGGVERHVRLLTEELERRGHHVKELSISIASLDSSARRKLLARNDAFFKFRAWKYLWGQRKLLRWADIVHVHDIFWWYLPFALIAKIAKISEKREPRVFVTFHGWEGRCPPTRSAVWQKKLAAFLSGGTIGVGSFFKKWYGVRTDRVVWGATRDKLINRQIDKLTSRRIRDFRIVFFGRLEKVNGIDLVIESMKKIVAPAVRSLSSEASGLAPESVATAGFGRASGFLPCKNPGPSEEEVNGVEIAIKAIELIRNHKVQPWRTPRLNLSRFSFIGDGSWRKQAEKVGRVTGMVENPWKYLAGADVVIASSYLAILEAAAMGKRIIAVADNPLKKDYLEGHPLRKSFKICRSADELAREIIKSIEETPRLGGESPLRARLWAMEQTPENLADEYEELWKGGPA